MKLHMIRCFDAAYLTVKGRIANNYYEIIQKLSQGVKTQNL